MKNAATGAILMGLLLLIGGLVWDSAFAGIPYQDPTPALAARYAHHAAIASWIGRAGLALLVAGTGLAIVRMGTRRLQRPRE